MTIDLTKKIDVIPELYVCTVSPASGTTNPKFQRLNPRKDEAVRHYHSGQYTLVHIAMRHREIGRRCLESKDFVSEALESEIADFVTEAEAYGRLFEAAPRTKLEHGKMLAMLKRYVNGEFDLAPVRAFEGLIAEIEQSHS